VSLPAPLGDSDNDRYDEWRGEFSAEGPSNFAFADVDIVANGGHTGWLTMKIIFSVLLALAILTSCAGGGATLVFYVVNKPAAADHFILAIAGLAKEDGMETAIGKTEFNTGSVLNVL